MLDVLAETDAAGVRTDRYPELRRKEEYGESFVHSTDPAGVQLAYVDGFGLEQLLEDDAVLNVLTRRDADRRDLTTMRAWPRTSSGLVGSSIHHGS